MSISMSEEFSENGSVLFIHKFDRYLMSTTFQSTRHDWCISFVA